MLNKPSLTVPLHILYALLCIILERSHLLFKKTVRCMALQKCWFSVLLSNKKQHWVLQHFSICRFLFGYKVIALNIAFYFSFLFFQVDMGLPFPQRVVQLPEIAWDQYTTSLGNFEREFKNRKRNSRRVKLIFDKGKRKWAYVTRKK